MDRLTRLDSNLFGDQEIVILLAADDQGDIHLHMARSYEAVSGSLGGRGLSFLYPQVIGEADDAGILRMMAHHFPYAVGEAPRYGAIRRALSDPLPYARMLGLEPDSLPCMVHISRSGDAGGWTMGVFPLSDADAGVVDQAVSVILQDARSKRGGIQASVGGREPYQTPLDREFEQASNLLSVGLKAQIEKELALNRGVGALRMLLFMLRGMRERGLHLDGDMQRLLMTLGDDVSDRPSRLIVGVNGPLILPDYGKEVTLTPLQKTVYLLFLNHEEGILFKDLRMHREEMLSIYRRLSNKSSIHEIVRSVDVLSNPLENSMSEKCARIKEAFLRVMDDRLAMHYYVRGGRNEPKRIGIDRGLVALQ